MVVISLTALVSVLLIIKHGITKLSIQIGIIAQSVLFGKRPALTHLVVKSTLSEAQFNKKQKLQK